MAFAVLSRLAATPGRRDRVVEILLEPGAVRCQS
jgi:hypothetical protein